MEELVLAQNVTTDSIYSVKSAMYTSSTIILDDYITAYRLKVTEDMSLSIDTSKLSEFNKYTCEFTLDIWANGEHAINLSNCDIQQIQVFRGMNRLAFKHTIGNSVWNVKIEQIGNAIAEFVRPMNGYDIPLYWTYGVATAPQVSTTAVGIQVFNWDHITTPNTANSENGHWIWTLAEVPLYAIFPAPFILTEFRLHVGSTSLNYPTSIAVYGSNDYNNWNEVFSINNLTYTVSQEIKVLTPTIQKPYRAYKFVCATTGPNIYIMPISLIGYKCMNIGNVRFYRYPKIAAATSGYELSANTADGITVNQPLYYCVNTDQTNGRAELIRSSSDVPFKITYKLPQAVRFEGFVVKSYEEYRKWMCNGWFKWEGSNDGTNWTRLCELRRPFSDYYVNNMFLYYMCHTQGTYDRFRITVYTVWDEWENDLLTGGLFPIYTLPEEYRNFDTIVPIMESDSQDGYTVSSSSTSIGDTYKMYDRDVTTYGGGAISGGQWITLIDMGSSIVVKGISLQAASDNYSKMPITFSVQGSADNDTWQLLQSYALGGASWSGNNQVQTFTVNNTTGYRYYRMVVTATQESGSDVKIGGLGWSSDAGQAPIDYYTDSYLVPIMSSNEQDGYTASASSYYSVHPAYWAFDRSGETKWLTDTGASINGSWLKIELPTAQLANVFSIQAPNEGGDLIKRVPTAFKIQGSNDDSDWDDLVSVSGLSWTANEIKYWNNPYTTSYLYYRLLISANGGDGYTGVGAFNLLSRTYFTN